MDKGKTRITIILVVIVIFLITTALMVRFEVNPISYFVEEDNNSKVVNEIAEGYNGVYRYKESLNDTYKLFNGCTISYFDYYIVVLNDGYYRYKSSCVGTFLLDEGKTKDLKFGKTLENTKKIIFDEVDYLKNDTITEIKVQNYYRENIRKTSSVNAENYRFLLKESQIPGDYFSINRGSLYSSNATFNYALNVLDQNSFELKLFGDKKDVIYSYRVNDFDDLPLFLGFGSKMTVIEPVEDFDKYHYTFRLLNNTGAGIEYDLKNKFPITVDDDVLTVDDSIYIKYSYAENAFIMLVGDSKTFCEKGSNSNEVAYYVFHIKYNYLSKSFDNPNFIKKVYKNEECKYVDDLMEG